MRVYAAMVLAGLIVALAACKAPADEAAKSKRGHADPRNSEAGLASSMLAAIREPGPGELQSPEAVVRHLLEALRDHDVDEYLKCFPVRHELEKFDLAAQIEQLGIYSPQHVHRLPGDTYYNLQDIVRSRLTPFYQLTFSMLLSSSAGELDRIDPKSPDGQTRIAEIRRALDLKRLQKMKIGPIGLRDLPHNKMPEKMRIVGASDFKFMAAAITFEDEKLDLLVVVGKFGDHWRVHTVLHDVH